MIVFTSIATNYVPKAIVLANSLKQFHPAAKFVVCLVEKEAPDEIEKVQEFDEVIRAEQLGMPCFRSFIFRHNVVEACTAVKGPMFKFLFKAFPNHREFIYLDPDIFVLSRMDELLDALQKHSIILTPHLVEPEDTHDAILDNEVCALRHGVFNLGFLALSRHKDSYKFVEWWSDRLYNYCYADCANGLFTDQKWMDFAPSFFPGTYVLRHPGYNVAPWNLSRRKVLLAPDGTTRVGDFPVRFVHFSGMDSGANDGMLNKYAEPTSAIFGLRDKYVMKCGEAGQHQYEKKRWTYGHYSDGTAISNSDRVFYRARPDVQARFPDPFDTSILDCYRDFARFRKPMASLMTMLKLPQIQSYLGKIRALARRMRGQTL
jgi:hypothetical protein